MLIGWPLSNKSLKGGRAMLTHDGGLLVERFSFLSIIYEFMDKKDY